MSCFGLSQMILHKVFHGVLDQGRGCLIRFDELEADVRPLFPIQPCSYLFFQNTYGQAIGTLEHVSKVVDSLYAKVRPFVVSGCWLSELAEARG
jgi:26S proteasome regulatory subunit N6